MELLVLILKKVGCLGAILAEMMDAGISGATIVDAQGMLTTLNADTVEPPPIFGSLRHFLNPEREEQKMILVVLPKEQIVTVRRIIDQETGGLDQPNSGILFTVPLSYTEGVKNK